RESECYGGGVARAADDAGGGAARSGAAHAISRAFAGAGIAIARAALADCVAGQRSFVAVRRGDRALRLARAGMAGHHRGRSEIVVADEFWRVVGAARHRRRGHPADRECGTRSRLDAVSGSVTGGLLFAAGMSPKRLERKTRSSLASRNKEERDDKEREWLRINRA